MDIIRAKELLTMLADGVNPLTGEVLSDEDSCNQVEIVRALNVALRVLENQSKRRTGSPPENAGKPWLAEDDVLLCKMFDEGCSKAKMREHFKRSTASIEARLVKCGKIAVKDGPFWK